TTLAIEILVVLVRIKDILILKTFINYSYVEAIQTEISENYSSVNNLRRHVACTSRGYDSKKR
ncbi:MAG: hypothetical protein ACJ72R_11255, partial [Nitrososphaeraceae archaeon]